MSKKGFAPVLMILLVAVFVSGLIILHQVTSNRFVFKPASIPTISGPKPTQLAKEFSPSQLLATASAEVTRWKTYIEPKYHFQVTYPAVGVVLTRSATGLGQCGSNFGLKQINSGSEVFSADGFFYLSFVKWSGSLESYLTNLEKITNTDYHISDFYDKESVENSGADGIAFIKRANPVRERFGKENYGYSTEFDPLDLIRAVYFKNGLIYIMQTWMGGDIGCLYEGDYSGSVSNFIHTEDEIRVHEQLAKIYKSWDRTKSLKFL